MNDTFHTTERLSGCWIVQQDSCCVEKLNVYGNDSAVYSRTAQGWLSSHSPVSGGGFGCEHAEHISVSFSHVEMSRDRFQFHSGKVRSVGRKLWGPGFCYGGGLAYAINDSGVSSSTEYFFENGSLVVMGQIFDKRTQPQYLDFEDSKRNFYSDEKRFKACPMN